MKRLVWFLPAMAWATLIFWLSSRSSVPSFIGLIPAGDKLVHGGFYGVLAGLLLFGSRGPADRSAWLWAVVASAYGITDELHQTLVPGRSCDVLDWLADTTGAMLCVYLWLQLQAPWRAWLRQRRGPHVA